MRQLLLIASTVALLLYMALASQQHGVAQSLDGSAAAVSRLELALAAASARPERMTLTAIGTVSAADAVRRATEDLGWPVTNPDDPNRMIRLHTHNGLQHLSIRWVLDGSYQNEWPAAHSRLYRAVERLGIKPSITVELEGSAPYGSPVVAVNRALDRLEVTERQPWSDTLAASSAGRTHLLPADSRGVNVQVAARIISRKRGTRIWVGWPVLLQEY